MINILKNNTYILNTTLNYVFKIFSMLVTYITIPLTLSYLGDQRYGVWQTILTVISWASLSNFGIGNGLRNKVTESITHNDNNKLKSYITSAYIYLTIIATFILICSITLLFNLDITLLFKNNNVPIQEIKLSFIIIIINFCLNFILGISSSIAFGSHRSSTVNFFQFIVNIITLLGLLILPYNGINSIVKVALVYFIANTLSNILFSFYIFADQKFRPNLKFRNKDYGKELTSLGLEFFILQVSTLVLFSTDNFIVSSLIGAEEVTQYSLVSKLFQIISTFFSILLVQLWSEVARAITASDYTWIKGAIKKLLLLLLPIACILLLMVINFDLISKLWLGRVILIDRRLILLSAIYSLLICFNGIFVNVQNGMSKIRVQTISSLICCIINIPLAIILIKVFNLGSLGVMISNIICLSISSIMCSIDVLNRLKKY